MYCGKETKVMLNANKPRPKRSQLEQDFNKGVVILIGMLALMCLWGSLGNYSFNSRNDVENYPYFGISDKGYSSNGIGPYR